MSPWHIAAIFAAGIAAGTINTVVGSGTLITFPTLLAFGYAPVTANVSNTVGLVPGSVSGAFGYRHELSGQRERVIALGAAALAGGTLGAILLLVLPASAFKAIVPFFIAVALIMILTQKQITRLVGDRRRGHGEGVSAGALAGAFCCGVYGGYFGAAQGILMLSVLGLSINDTLQRLNAVKVITDRSDQPRRWRCVRDRRARRLGRRGADRGRLDHRRRNRCSLRPPPTTGRATGTDRGGRDHRDRATGLSGLGATARWPPPLSTRR